MRNTRLGRGIRTFIITGGFLLLAAGMGETSADAANVSIDKTHFPDETFRSYVQGKFDRNGDNILSERELRRARHLRLVGETEVALSDATDKRKKLDITGMELLTKLTSVQVSGWKLSGADFSTLTELKKLDVCYSNLTTLSCSELSELQVLKCCDNAIRTLGISKNRPLQRLECCRHDLDQ